ncbi:ABC transporter ATP-binding protein [Leuconostoc gasicomitatum]|uniref:ABC transporter ATP-binding protein n=1 Tax=Leuconostoc gasicomitatum TaxID=115778 RepID=UPI000BCF2063|nr:ABC transporter ATP-binding protein [Leuconostoc gasicomitatum]MBZ5944845.1 ABC transporter ATP-binding protein [Leuconostoc gasicomitatum]MBZ5945886.1 ABC transporter ATP-binding protein [Leuconostoc gasicomitatum]MBZ5949705.1 ABC transporter ATP-binding protein [Leuconostoc gasicomitatum]MBZ5951464.1 ABC transporter ATP-binding protein [Leuconostoc gasicomitatum]MBZ5967962.1 ABC transporter ATP-binding protein [Leuconostoc gasicomitatum]
MNNSNRRMSPSEIKEQLSKSNSTIGEMIRFVFGSVLKRRGLVILNIFLLTSMAGLNFMVPQFTKNIIDHVLPQNNQYALYSNIFWLLITTLILGTITFFSTYMMQILSQRAITDLRIKTYNDILKQDYAFFQDTKTGDLMVRLTSDISNLQMLISSNTFSIIGNIFTFIGVLTFLFVQNWHLALLVSITFPILFVTIRFFRSRIRESYSNVRYAQSKINNQLQATLTEIELIKSYTSENSETDKFKAIANESNNYSLTATKWQAIFQPLITLINTIGIAIVLLFGSLFVMRGTMTVGDLVAYIAYVTMLQDPIRSFSMLMNVFQTAQVSYDRIKNILSYHPSVLEVKEPVDFPNPLKTGITLQQVTFEYDVETNPALNHVSFTIPSGKTTALVGRSGSGKSTITKLLTRMYDRSAGDMTFDGIDIKQFNLSNLRQNIAVVSQDVTIVDGTIADNIAYGTENVTQNNIWQAAQQADIADFIRQLPHQLNTEVGERGVKLSGGQKQRLSIARALLKNAPIVILDEATAALDNESEKAIQHALDNLMVAKTAIVIAHRLSTIHKADQIIVMNAGQVAEIGTHQSLLADNGIYRHLYDAQFE